MTDLLFRTPEKPARRDLLEDHARERAGMSPEWKMYRWEKQPANGTSTFVNVTGAVCSAVFKAGPRKGYTNWSKLDKTTECTVSLGLNEHKEWLGEWERKTGQCNECQGSGQQPAGWTRAEGPLYRACPRCLATGKAP